MPLWTDQDTANGAPKYNDANTTYFVDATEAGVDSNRAKGLRIPGWHNYTTYTDADGNTRHRQETLVAMTVAAATSGDEGTSANTDIEDDTVADS